MAILKNLFGIATKTTLNDDDRIAVGTSTANASNITWASFKAFLNTFFYFKSEAAKVGGDAIQDFNPLTIYLNLRLGSIQSTGVTSDEFWTILGAADDLSWVVFHYAGAAGAVGQVIKPLN